MAKVFIGTSGWQYRHWRDSFYAGRPTKEWLAYAASRFTSLEVDATFYRLQKKETLARWAESTPPDFKFALRGHRYTTHNKKLTDPIPSIEKQIEPANALGNKLIAVLWQLPPSFRKNVGRLKDFAIALDRVWPGPRHAIEFRDPSWFDREIADVLGEFNLANTISDAGKWPRWDALTTNFVYLRLHGKPYTYASDYEPSELDGWAERIRRWRRDDREVCVYFDNDSQGHAPFDAIALMDRLTVAGATAARLR